MKINHEINLIHDHTSAVAFFAEAQKKYPEIDLQHVTGFDSTQYTSFVMQNEEYGKQASMKVIDASRAQVLEETILRYIQLETERLARLEEAAKENTERQWCLIQ